MALVLLAACTRAPRPAPAPPSSTLPPVDEVRARIRAEVAAGLEPWRRACPGLDADGLCTTPTAGTPGCSGPRPYTPAPTFVPRDAALVAQARVHLEAAVELARDLPEAVEDAAPAALALADLAFEELLAEPGRFDRIHEQRVHGRYSELFARDPYVRSSLRAAGYARLGLLYEHEARRDVSASIEKVNPEALRLGYCGSIRSSASYTLDHVREMYTQCVAQEVPAWAAICKQKWAAIAPGPPRTDEAMERATRLFEELAALSDRHAGACATMGTAYATLAAANRATLDEIARFTVLSPDERAAVGARYGPRFEAITRSYMRAHDACVRDSTWSGASGEWQSLLVQIRK